MQNKEPAIDQSKYRICDSYELMIYFHMQRFNFMVIEERFFKEKKKKKKMKNMDKMWKSFFQILCVSHITLLPIFVYRLFFTRSLP